MTHEDDPVVRELADLAGELVIGPVPSERVVAGGRRRRRRRLLRTAGAAVAAAAVVVGGTVAAVDGSDRSRDVVSAAATASPTGSAAPASPTAAARDPFTPVRAVIAEGTSGGRKWQAWAALWPQTTQVQAVEQDGLIWRDRHSAIPYLPHSTPEQVLLGWRPGRDLVNLYLTVDGKRLVNDTVHDVEAPPGPTPDPSRTPGLSGALLGLKGGEMGSTPVLVASVEPEVARVVCTWADGSTSEPALVTVGDSRVRWFALPQKAGVTAEAIRTYAADGRLLGTNVDWLR